MILPDLNITDENKLYRAVSKIVAYELSNISISCYYPKLTKYYQDLQQLTNIDETHIKIFKKSLDPKYRNMSVLTDKYTLLLIMSLIYFKRKNKNEISKILYKLLVIKFYSNLLHKHFPKFCDEKTFSITIERLSARHLFKVKNGIPNALMYISDFEFERIHNKLKSPELSDADLTALVYMLRHKVAQSVRSFAELFYKIHQDESITQSEEDLEQKGSSVVADKISMSICTYGQVDKVALTMAINNSGLRKSIAFDLISNLSNPDYKDQLKFIIILLSRVDDLKNICVEKTRNRLIRRVHAGSSIGKYNVKDQFKSLIKNVQVSSNTRTTYMEQLVSFTLQYITLFLRNRIC